MEITMAGFLITTKCNLHCKMCCFSCGPTNNIQMDYDSGVRAIRDIGRTVRTEGLSLKTIGFSGGEATLRGDVLFRFLDCCFEQELRSTLTTNAWWASNYAEADRYIKTLCAHHLSKLNLSLDAFHQEKVPVANVANALRVAKGNNLPCDMGSTITHSTARLGSYMDELGELLIGMRHVIYPCLPVGAAAENIPPEDFIVNPHVLTGETRCGQTNVLAVYCDGSCYPCCSQCGCSRRLYLGNLFSEGLDAILKHYNANIYLRIINKYGLSWFVNAGKKVGIDIAKGESYVNLCDVCQRVFANEELMAAIGPQVEDEKAAIYERYLASVH